MLYAMLLVEIYGAKLLLSGQLQPRAAALLYGVSAVLLPLFRVQGVATLLLAGALLIVGPSIVFILTVTLTLWRPFGIPKSPAKVTAWLAVVSGLILVAGWTRRWIPSSLKSGAAIIRDWFAESRDSAVPATTQRKFAVAMCGLVLVLTACAKIPSLSRLWNPVISPDLETTEWREVQHWAKSHTFQSEKFLVPPCPFGFRVYSERTSWVDWRDGAVAYILPQYAAEWRRRMRAIGIELVAGQLHFERMAMQYKRQTWEHLRALADAQKLDYVVQFAEVHYNIVPVYSNRGFAIYKVSR